MKELDHETQFAQLRRTRRNLMAMAAIAGSALLVRARSASAAPVDPDDNDGPDGDHDSDDQPQCFLKGTQIETVGGWRKVEELSVGDMLPTVFGGVRPIQWIGVRRFKRSDSGKPWAKSVCPVRVQRSALGQCTPHADLFLTPAHALYMDGALVRVGSLVNGMTISQDPMRDLDELELFHVKLETHDVIFAEGAACETLLTVDEKASNFADYFRAHGAPESNDVPCLPILSYEGSGRKEMTSRLRSALSPLVDYRQEIDVIRDRLEERALALSGRLEAVS
jgi:hypothetical protein